MEVKKICVLGAGLMGSGIAQVFAEAGFEVSMRDIEDRFVQGGLSIIKKNYERAISKGKMTKERADGFLSKIKGVVEMAPSNASKDYGKPFIETFKQANYDFYKIDPNLFAPAILVINNLRTGNTFTKGELNSKALEKSFGFKNLG